MTIEVLVLAPRKSYRYASSAFTRSSSWLILSNSASDEIFLPGYGRALADSLGAGLQIIDGAGHLPNYENKKVFNPAVLDFLNAH